MRLKKSFQFILLLALIILITIPTSHGFVETFPGENIRPTIPEEETTNDEAVEEPVRDSPNRITDHQITSSEGFEEGSLINVVDDLNTSEELTLPEKISAMTNLVNRIRTAEGARIVLEVLPKTIDDLNALKTTTENITEKEAIDANIVELLIASERLVEMISQPSQTLEAIKALIPAIGRYYSTLEPTDSAAKEVMLTSVRHANIVTKQTGTLYLNWSTISIEDGRVLLMPSQDELLAAIKYTSTIEAQMENLLTTHMTQGLENATVSTLFISIPKNLERAVKSGTRLDNKTLELLKKYGVEKVQLFLGPVSFGITDKFIDKHPGTNFAFNVEQLKALSEDDIDSLPEGTTTIDAPVLNLTALQNFVANDGFQHPFEVRFHLDYFDYNPIHPNKLFIARYDETSKKWIPVGGKYDPVTNSIVVYRMHLSKYTVLKSEKNYNTIEDSWAKNEIAALTNKGIINEADLLNVNGNVTREEFAGWVAKAYGLDTEVLKSDLKDLDANSPYYDAITTAYNQGIITGKSSGKFDPDNTITKAEMAVMIASAVKTYEYPVNTNTFDLAKYEADLPNWAINSTETVTENNIVNESFMTTSSELVSREDAAAILYKAYR